MVGGPNDGPFWLKICGGYLPQFLSYEVPRAWHGPRNWCPLDLWRACRAYLVFRIQCGLAFTRSAGDPGDDFRLLAALPPAAIAATTEAATLDSGDHLTVVQAAQLGLVYRLAEVAPRQWLGSEALDRPGSLGGRGNHHTERGGPQGCGEGTNGAQDEIFINFGPRGRGVCDFIAMEEQKQRGLENFVHQTGGLPLEQEEPSTEQISALGECGWRESVRRLLSMAPLREESAQRAEVLVIPAGAGGIYHQRNPWGGSCDQWRASFSVYRTALLKQWAWETMHPGHQSQDYPADMVTKVWGPHAGIWR